MLRRQKDCSGHLVTPARKLTCVLSEHLMSATEWQQRNSPLWMSSLPGSQAKVWPLSFLVFSSGVTFTSIAPEKFFKKALCKKHWRICTLQMRSMHSFQCYTSKQVLQQASLVKVILHLLWRERVNLLQSASSNAVWIWVWRLFKLPPWGVEKAC